MIVLSDTYCVYIHTNKINGKKYVGQTHYQDNPNLRWQNGKGYVQSTLFHNAIQKYGWNNFEHEVIASNLTKEEADNFEKLLIKELDTRNPRYGYNLRDGGSNGKMMEETKRKIANANSGERNYMYGKHHTQETKAKISQAKKGKPSPVQGVVKSDEWRAKISQSLTGKYLGEKHPKAKKIKCVETNIIYGSSREAERETGINRTHILSCCQHKPHHITAGGYHWEYA